MRTLFIQLLPYVLVLLTLSISQETQSQLALVIQEKTLSFHSLFSKKGTIQSESKKILPPPSKTEQEGQFFHTELDSFSPWIMAHILSHKETPWSHTAWIDIGKDTQGLSFPLMRGCPLVVGKDVVGIVEQVGEKSSLIRLISDPLLRPSVQVMRSTSDLKAEESLTYLLDLIQKNPTLLPKENHRVVLQKLLLALQSSLSSEKPLLLAKGELQGALSLKQPNILRGLGFNYDVGDEENPPRDIRTGQTDPSSPKLLLIQQGDLLVTNGLDGLYPQGLRVARVSSVLPLEEGGFAYEITAEASCPSLLDLHLVACLPAIGQEKEAESADLKALLHQIEEEIQKSS